MKPLLLLLLLVSIGSHAQKLVLVDHNFHQPFLIADSITIEQAATGLLPIYFRDLQPVISAMEKLAKDISSGRFEKEAFISRQIGNSLCVIKTEKARGSDLYRIVLNTTTANLKTHIVLAASEPYRRAVQRLTMFLDYLKNNQAILPGKSVD